MAFGKNIKKTNVVDMFNPVSDIKDVYKSIILFGESGTGKSVSVTGGKFKKLSVGGKYVSVDIGSFPLPMAVLDVDSGSLDNIKTHDLDTQKQFLYSTPTQVDEIIDMLDSIFEHNYKVTNGEEGIFDTGCIKTVFVDGIHHVWSALTSNMSLIKARQSNIDLIKGMSSGKLTNISKVTPEGTEYVPANATWKKVTESLRKNKQFSYVVCCAGIEISEWARTKTTKFLGHKNQQADYDIWGMSKVVSNTVLSNGNAGGAIKKYTFDATRVRGGISGKVIENFCYDKLKELY